MKKWMLKILFVLGFAVLVYFGACADFYIWRLQHPQAPTWTYFFN